MYLFVFGEDYRFEPLMVLKDNSNCIDMVVFMWMNRERLYSVYAAIEYSIMGIQCVADVEIQAVILKGHTRGSAS